VGPSGLGAAKIINGVSFSWVVEFRGGPREVKMKGLSQEDCHPRRI